MMSKIFIIDLYLEWLPTTEKWLAKSSLYTFILNDCQQQRSDLQNLHYRPLSWMTANNREVTCKIFIIDLYLEWLPTTEKWLAKSSLYTFILNDCQQQRRDLQNKKHSIQYNNHVHKVSSTVITFTRYPVQWSRSQGIQYSDHVHKVFSTVITFTRYPVQ